MLELSVLALYIHWCYLAMHMQMNRLQFRPGNVMKITYLFPPKNIIFMFSLPQCKTSPAQKKTLRYPLS